MFEIHEVDDEVLSMLAFADLKDMGINVVGSRRKFRSLERDSHRLCFPFFSFWIFVFLGSSLHYVV